MFNKYSRKRKIREFKQSVLCIYYGIILLYIYHINKLFGYDWKTGRYDKKHIIGRFLHKELRVGTTLISKEEVTVHPLKDPSGIIENCNYVQRDEIP